MGTVKKNKPEGNEAKSFRVLKPLTTDRYYSVGEFVELNDEKQIKTLTANQTIK